jgi:hypothetical protein
MIETGRKKKKKEDTCADRCTNACKGGINTIHTTGPEKGGTDTLDRSDRGENIVVSMRCTGWLG